MKLSEAILLGSTVLAPKAGRQHYSELNAGCALGMAAVAAGCTFRPVTEPFARKDKRTLGAEGVWGNWLLTVVSRPCACWRIRVPRKMRIKDVVAHLFDHHVMARQDWTLEQLVAWVETVEPKHTVCAATPYQNPAGRISSERRLLFGPQFEPSPQELEEWQAIRRNFEGRPGTEPRSMRICH